MVVGAGNRPFDRYSPINYHIMRQIKNCKVGHFVKHEGVICQVNCFYTGYPSGRKTKMATIIQVGEPGEKKRLFTLDASTKVDYLGVTARDEKGRIWIGAKRDPMEEWNDKH